MLIEKDVERESKLTIADLLQVAYDRGASDLHVTVGIPPKIRINGVLVNMDFPVMKPDMIEELLCSTFSPYTKKVFDEKGEVDFAYSTPGLGRFRVNAFHQRGSFAFVMRLVGRVIPKPEQLGIPKSVVELTAKKRGLVLVTGPTGSGKSTTLASLIDIVNEKYSSHIITLEDPIEYLYTHKKSVVNQREVGLDTVGFSQALRSALREDPDVILVGEMRDLDTIQIAITAAETGHLVFSTLHTTGAANTIDRIIDVFPPYQQQQIRIQLANVLESIISQQLIPTLDQKGRVAAFEVLHAVPAVRNLIREAKSHQIESIIQTNKKIGMQTMDDAIYELFQQRKIDTERALQFAQNMEALKKRLY